MPTEAHDTEITLGTGRMLVLFFLLVVVCAGFFAVGFKLGRKTAAVESSSALITPAGTPAAVVRPSAAKNNPPPASSQFTFFKAVGQKNADSQLPAKEPAPQSQSAASATSTPPEAPQMGASDSTAPPATNGYFVQVAAVSHQEDANALVEALKKKQYPAFTVSNPSGDKLFHVQIGPFADIKDAELMRGRLTGDGYTPILKK